MEIENKHITTDEIKAYINGEMTMQEVGLLENHVLNCAFCNDALEGMEMMPVSLISNQLKYNLKTKINKRVQSNPSKVLMPLGQIIGLVASLLIILTVSFFVLNKTFKTKQNVTNEKKVLNNEKIKIAEKKDSVLKIEIKKTHINPTRFISKNNPFEFQSPKIVSSSIQLNKSKVLSTEIKLKEFIDDRFDIILNEDSEQILNEEIAINEESKIFQPENSQLITGLVTSKNGEVMPGAGISIKGFNAISTTDNNGNFALKNIKVGQILVISFIGMKSQEIKVQKENQSFKVQLEDDSQALSEVIVTSYMDVRPDRMIEPVMGWTEFKKFIKSNINYPDSLVQNKIKGKVILNLEISNNGTVESFSFTRKLGFGCEEESLRLLKDIQWLPAFQEGEKVRSNIRIAIKFGN